ncbi:hypothetical protein B0H63DRAFT_430652 [Podospora didyma]|uniref:Uncharacterized protein n=1 Tax=Podospora didyma TaxID=330526 RepID=A0AAE0U0V3_9PEZI|nr:hypothetical protein B0H63DRAFT_430652 [Podospora didyma]
MDSLHQHFTHKALWEKWDVSQSPTIDVTEIWAHDDSSLSTTRVQTNSHSSVDLDNWLDEPRQTTIQGEPHTRLLRLVWIGQNPATSRRSPSTKVLTRLLEVWNIQDAYDYAQSTFAGVAALPPPSQNSNASPSAHTFTVTYHPKLAAAWSHGPGKETHCVIFAEGEQRVELLRILTSSPWTPSLTSHAMFPALLSSLMLGHELDSTLEDIKLAVREVEARTGHHRFTTRRQTQPAAGELASLSASMSGCAAKLANGARKLALINALNSFIQSHSSHSHSQSSTSPGSSASARVEENMTLLHHRTEMQTVDASYTQQRVQVQVAALGQLIAQQDNAIAFDTARATRSIAASSLQDSSAMKMLALVTMFFMPGSFVAALLSTPLFVWPSSVDGSGLVTTSGGGGGGGGGGGVLSTRPQFVLFWAITVPLTVCVFVLYGMWMVVLKRKDRRRRKKGVEV